MNFKKKIKFATFLLLPTVLISCGVTGAPDCSDESVTSLVKEITLEKIKDNYAKHYSPYAGGMKYKELKQSVDNGSKALAKYLNDVEKDAANSKIKISGIRTQEKNDEILKSSCVCQLTVNKKNPLTKKPDSINADITYTAQYSDTGEDVYVEVFGL